MVSLARLKFDGGSDRSDDAIAADLLQNRMQRL
jgi:hypothetical protein